MCPCSESGLAGLRGRCASTEAPAAGGSWAAPMGWLLLLSFCDEAIILTLVWANDGFCLREHGVYFTSTILGEGVRAWMLVGDAGVAN